MIRFSTAGESHGKGLIAILEGIPAGLTIDNEDIDVDLARRQKSYGRGQRMRIETDQVSVISGIRFAKSIGSPISLFIKNRDWENWKYQMSTTGVDLDGKHLHNPRPGHADLTGLMKYGVHDFRDILERASARETAARVAVGAICRELLKKFGIIVYSYVDRIGTVAAKVDNIPADQIHHLTEMSFVRCPDKVATKKMINVIKSAFSKGNTLGGSFKVIAENVPAGLGSHTQWDLKIDGRLAQSLMSIQAIKSVSFGLGTELAKTPGSEAHDEIFYSQERGFYRKTNRAGGVEGGMTNGERIEISCTMKPIPSLIRPLKSVNVHTKKPSKAEAVRSDVCAVPSAGIVGEAAVAFELARAMVEKFGGDCMDDMMKNYNNYMQRLKNL